MQESRVFTSNFPIFKQYLDTQFLTAPSSHRTKLARVSAVSTCCSDITSFIPSVCSFPNITRLFQCFHLFFFQAAVNHFKEQETAMDED